MKNRTDLFFITFTVIGILFFLYIIQKSYAQQENISGQEIIGVVSQVNKTVKRKSFSHVIWNPIHSKTILYNKDYILTGQNASVTILLKDQTKDKESVELILDDNALTFLERTEDTINLQLEQGQITLNTKKEKKKKTSEKKEENILDKKQPKEKKLQIEVGEKTILLEKATVNIKKIIDKNKKKDDFQVTVHSGKVEIEDKKTKKKITTLKENSEIQFSNEKYKVKDYITNIRFNKPKPNDKYFTDKNKFLVPFSIRFKRNKRNRKKYFVQISNNKKFYSIIYRKNLINENFSIPLKKGVYYWRIQYKDKAQYSITKKFTIHQIRSKITLHNPNNLSVINSYEKEKLVSFSWGKHPHASYYDIEIYKDKNLKNIFLKKTVYSNQISINLKPDVYYWRVAPKAKGGNNVFSMSKSFQLMIKKSTAPVKNKKLQVFHLS